MLSQIDSLIAGSYEADCRVIRPDRSRRWRFAELLEDPAVKARWERVRKWFFLRESTYDISNRCNLACDGCYYYEGQKQFAEENREADPLWKLTKLMRCSPFRVCRECHSSPACPGPSSAATAEYPVPCCPRQAGSSPGCLQGPCWY